MKKLSLLLLCILTADVSRAATVSWGAAIDTGIIDVASLALPVGNVVRIGYFGSFSGALITANATTNAGLSILDSDFHQFAQSTIGTGTANTPATFSVNSTPSYASLSGFTPNTQIYFWAFKSSNTSSIANVLATASETAIAYVPFANNSSWQFPASDIAAAKSIDLTQLSNANTVVLAGNYKASNTASLTGIFGATNHALQLATVVPEPSVITFSIIGFFGAAQMRRRKRK